MSPDSWLEMRLIGLKKTLLDNRNVFKNRIAGLFLLQKRAALCRASEIIILANVHVIHSVHIGN